MWRALLLLLAAAPPSFGAPAWASDIIRRTIESTDPKILMQSGKLAEARAALEQRLGADPHDIEALFLLGLIAAADGDLPAAARRFQDALAAEPGATRIRLELARTLFLMKEDEAADYHFRLAIAAHPPEEVVRNIARFREIIRARRAWQFNVTFGIAPDSNINAATSRERVDIFGLPFEIDPEARARSGVGVIAGGEASYRFWRERKAPFYIGAYGRAARYGDARFNDIYLGAEVGPEFRLSGGRLRVAATGLERWYGGKPLVTSGGGRLAFDKVIGGFWGIEASLLARRNDYARRADVDGWDVEGGAIANRPLSISVLGFAYAFVLRGLAKDPGQSNWQGRLGFGLVKEWRWGLRPNLALEGGRQVNDAPLLLLDKTRRDWRFQASAGLTKRDWNVGGFAPSVKVVWARNLSTISLYDQKRLRAEFGVTRAF